MKTACLLPTQVVEPWFSLKPEGCQFFKKELFRASGNWQDFLCHNKQTPLQVFVLIRNSQDRVAFLKYNTDLLIFLMYFFSAKHVLPAKIIQKADFCLDFTMQKLICQKPVH
ncbi:UNVERIFIED_CONTAM: hypothetical protein K2H54_017767 [Gekko kuhli]